MAKLQLRQNLNHFSNSHHMISVIRAKSWGTRFTKKSRKRNHSTLKPSLPLSCGTTEKTFECCSRLNQQTWTNISMATSGKLSN